MKTTPSLENSIAGTSDTGWLDAALQAVDVADVTVFGDFCLDGYWTLSEEEQELSVETGLPIRHVKTQEYSLGGAGSVAANLASLGVKNVRAAGPVGEDVFGVQMKRLLDSAGIDRAGLVDLESPWQTPFYAKPYRGGNELNRFDFGGANLISRDQLRILLDALDSAASSSNAVVINQQLSGSFINPETIGSINQIVERHPDVMFIVDARNHAELFSGVILKLNASEVARIMGEDSPPGSSVSLEDVNAYAVALSVKTGKPVVVTRGEQGLVIADSSRLVDIPGIQNIGRTDPVGAGDAVAATWAAVLGGGGDLEAAGRLANLAANITVGKLRTTGTVNRVELRAIGARPDYVYEPELAKSLRLARYVGESDIEVVREVPVPAIRYAIFDHDGTLSTLRQGWEQIMGPVMIEAILGDQLKRVSEEVYRRVENDALSFMDETTGIQTLAQMKGLVELVREYGFVPESEILDEHGYKAIYNEALLEMVHARIRRIERGELSSEDFEIKGARAMLDTLHAAGVKLYLASGTDEDDVKAEAEIMGYAHLFDGGIHGAVGDLKVEAKRVVLERIFVGSGLSGSEVVVVGDGPVELREGKKHGALCLGIASNELCRFGLDETKRTRVIRAGADYVVPDFSQLEQLKPLLGL